MYKVILGNVITDNGTVETGNFIELSDKDAKLLLAEGVVEEVKEEEKAKPKKEKKAKAKKAKVEKKEPEAVDAEPSLDWTRSELDEAAIALGVENPEKMSSKKKVLEAVLKAGGEKK